MVGILLAGNAGPLPLGGILALAWARWSCTPWREIGYVRPLFGAEPTNAAFQYLVGNSAALPAALWSVTFVAAFGEETVMRGFLFERLGKLFGAGWNLESAAARLVFG